MNEIDIPPLSDDERERGARETIAGKAVVHRATPHANGHATPIAPLVSPSSVADAHDASNPIRRHMREVEASTQHHDRAHRLDAETHVQDTPIDPDATIWDGATAYVVAAIVGVIGLLAFVMLLSYFAK